MANNIQLAAKSVADVVEVKIKELEKGGLAFPKNYSYVNALRSAQLVLLETKDKSGKPVLETCTKESIVNSLVRMITSGLNVAKNQCYFIPYGDKLTLKESYFGEIAMAKRLEEIENVVAYPLYDGDTFETEFDNQKGVLLVKDYKPKFGNIDIKKLVGAFCMVIGKEGVIKTEVMTMAQIVKAWEQSPTKGKSGAHTNFSEEMAKKTVIHRALKGYINTSDDAHLEFSSEEYEREEYKDVEVSEATKEEIKENANSEVIDIEPEETKPATEVDEEGQVEIAPSF